MITVRPARAADLPALDALFARSYPRLLKADYAPSVLVGAIPVIARAQPALVTSGTFFVAEEDGALRAAGGWTAAAPGRLPQGAPGTGHVRHVVTDDRHLRRGLAGRVMAVVMSTARDAGLARLDCASTLTAVPFYQAMGFATVGPITVPLGPAGLRFPAVLMRRTVSAL
jgi:GNAT superfamily N-acetyltransferase